MTGRRGVVAALTAAAALLTTGCAGVPEDTPVAAARRVEAPQVQLFADPPVRGDGPQGIVQGFIDAGLDFHQNHQVAREYLEGDGAQWQALAPVTVLDGKACIRLVSVDGVPTAGSACLSPGEEEGRGDAAASPPRDGQQAEVEVTARVQASIDDAGRFALRGAESFRQRFTLVARGGEWRIRTPPAGLLLTSGALSSTFAPLALYFGERAADPAGGVPPARGTWLVPDVRWFPSSLEPAATAATAVRALLGGPSTWLADAVTSGATRAVGLAPLAGVRIEDGVARVDLTRAPERPRLLQAQLLATLQQVPTGSGNLPVTSVEMTVQQVKLEVPPGPAPVLWSPPAQPPRDDRGTPASGSPLCLTPKGQVGQVYITDKPVCSERDDLAPLTRPVAAAVPAGDRRGSLFAVLGSTRDTVHAMVPGKKAAVPVLRGTRLTPPSVDGSGAAGEGWVWAASGVPGGALRAGRLDGRQVEVDVPWLAGGTIVSVRISPEGTRALLVVQRGTAAEAVVAGVVRAADDTPLRLAQQRLSLLPDLVSGADAVWTDTQWVAVLGSRGKDRRSYVWRVQLGGRVSLPVSAPLPGRPGAAGLAVSDNVLDVYVRTVPGGAYGRAAGSWANLDVRAPVMPG